MKLKETMSVKTGGKILVLSLFPPSCFISSSLLEESGNRNILFAFWEGYKRLRNSLDEFYRSVSRPHLVWGEKFGVVISLVFQSIN